MRTTLSALATLVIVGSANAAITLSFAEIGDATGNQGGVAGATDTVVYSGIPGPYAAFAANAYLGAANYSSIMANDAEIVTGLRFVGGVTTANTSLAFNFYDSSEVLISSFTLTLAQSGNYIWSVSLDAADGILAANTGWLEITGVDGATGKWFLTTTAPTIGSQVPVTGAYMHAFELTTNGVPAPGAVALLGLAGLVSRRRR